MVSKRMKWYFLLCIFGALVVALIGYVYTERDLPPYPGKIVTEQGQVLSTRAQVLAGQGVWQKYGLMDLGSVWGHGTYRGPDFTAQALHNVGQFMRGYLAQTKFNKPYAQLGTEQRGALDALTIEAIKKFRYDKAKDTLVLDPAQVAAFQENRAFYDKLFSQGDPRGPIRAQTIKDARERQALADFFWWTAWCAGVQRPGEPLTFTNNWPHDPSVGNTLPGKALVWSAINLVAFAFFLSLIVFLFHRWGFNQGSLPYRPEPAAALAAATISPSQKKTVKYFLVVSALFFLQVNMGGIMAHYTVNPSTFWGQDWFVSLVPYNWVKTWHLQLAVFWIATSWIATTLFVAPRVGGREPKGQGLLVDLLFVAVIIVALGSLLGEVAGLKGLLSDSTWFWIGHQGWEYLELGRLWQILLLVGLVLWLYMVVRALKSHFRGGQDKWGLPHFLAYSGVAVVGFFCFGLFYDPHTHLTIADFWRWWVVHTWVEGAFEFFAAAAIVFVVVNLGLVDLKSGLRTVYFTVGLALGSGIIGVGHHYYWFGDPSFWLALGSTISALEPVPIFLLLAEVWHGQKALVKAGSNFPFRYPLMFLMASVFWEVLGAAVMGLSITTPVVNYYEHATYLTVNHGHTALFGTYGMLAIGLLLFSMRGLVRPEGWNTKLLATSFWGLNIGLAIMFSVTLLPVGVMQVLDNIAYGFWHARSDAFWEQTAIQVLGQVRMLPDLLIILPGSGGLLLFMLQALTKLKPVSVKAGEEFK
ncbi:MAG: nitric-oxide reductase large subunit [Desulfarculus sp.]|nr:MAG: nitric-oxide reductase large subunit [Desulfarculus sp.]